MTKLFDVHDPSAVWLAGVCFFLLLTLSKGQENAPTLEVKVNDSVNTVIGDDRRSIEELTRIIERDPKNAAAYNDRGNLRARVGDLKGAISDLSRAIKLDPKNAAIYCNRANVKAMWRDLDGAIIDYTMAIRYDPTNFHAYYNRGNAKAYKGGDNDALDDWTMASKLNPKHVHSHENVARVKHRKGDLDGAIAEWNAIIGIEPNNSKAYGSRGVIRAQKRDYDNALADFDRAIELDPQDGRGYQCRGQLKDLRGDYDGAISDLTQSAGLFEKAMSSNHVFAVPSPGADVYWIMGWAKYKNGDAEAGLTDLDKAIEMNPKHAGAYLCRARIKLGQGKLKDGIAGLERAVALEPKNAAFLIELGRARMLMGDEAKAMNHFRKAVGLQELYGGFWLFLLASGKDQESAARKALEELLEQEEKRGAVDAWDSQIARFLLGKLNRDEFLLKAKGAKEEFFYRGNLCQAWFYIGMVDCIHGRSKDAADCFRKALATNRRGFSEYEQTIVELKRLGNSP